MTYMVEIRVPYSGDHDIRCSTYDSVAQACSAARSLVEQVEGGVARVTPSGENRTLHLFYGPRLGHTRAGVQAR